MIVARFELELVNRGRRRQMWLPVEHRSGGGRLPCPVEPEHTISLQPKPGVKGTRVTILPPVMRAKLSSMTEADARPLGVYGGLPAALASWARTHGPGEQEVWIVQFVLGDMTSFFSKHRERYLKAKGVGLTDDPERAVRGEPAVTTEEELKLARLAKDRRQLEERQALKLGKQQALDAIGHLRECGFSKEVEQALRYAQRKLDLAERILAEQHQQAA